LQRLDLVAISSPLGCLLRVRQALVVVVMSDKWDDLSTNRDGADAIGKLVLMVIFGHRLGMFWSSSNQFIK
jgi:hypothetical protein